MRQEEGCGCAPDPTSSRPAYTGPTARARTGEYAASSDDAHRDPGKLERARTDDAPGYESAH